MGGDLDPVRGKRRRQLDQVVHGRGCNQEATDNSNEHVIHIDERAFLVRIKVTGNVCVCVCVCVCSCMRVRVRHTEELILIRIDFPHVQISFSVELIQLGVNSPPVWCLDKLATASLYSFPNDVPEQVINLNLLIGKHPTKTLMNRKSCNNVTKASANQNAATSLSQSERGNESQPITAQKSKLPLSLLHSIMQLLLILPNYIMVNRLRI